MPQLSPTPEILYHRGLLPSQIHVRNLRAVTVAGTDAWGRPKKPQPLLVSASVGMSEPFSAAAATATTTTTTSDAAADTVDAVADAVDGSTVHYGLLAKRILAGLEERRMEKEAGEGEGGEGEGGGGGGEAVAETLAAVLVRVWSHLTGLSIDGGGKRTGEEETPFLDVTRLRTLSLSLVLPKASLLGTGVSITAGALFGPPEAADRGLVSIFAQQLALRGVRVPTLVGVNANERLAKQVVVADVEIERFRIECGDVYTELEGLVVKTMEESSYETLEALGTHIAEEIMSFVPPKVHLSGRDLGWQVKVSLEKPIAIPLADGPIVEVMLD